MGMSGDGEVGGMEGTMEEIGGTGSHRWMETVTGGGGGWGQRGMWGGKLL